MGVARRPDRWSGGRRRPGTLGPARRRCARRRRTGTRSRAFLCLAPVDDLRLVGIAMLARLASRPAGAPALVVGGRSAERARALGPLLDPAPGARRGTSAAASSGATCCWACRRCRRCSTRSTPPAPALVREVSRQVSPVVIAETLRRLLEEERLDPAAAAHPGGDAGGTGRTPASASSATSAVGRSRRHIAHPLLRGRSLEALLLDPAAELAFRDSLHGDGGPADPDAGPVASSPRWSGPSRRLRVRALLLAPRRRAPAAVATLVAQRFPGLAVLAYDELPPDLEVRPVGRAAFCE